MSACNTPGLPAGADDRDELIPVGALEHLHDVGLALRLGTLRNTTYDDDAEAAAAFAEIAALEIEAERRGFIPFSSHEPTPPSLALSRFSSFLGRGDVDNAAHWIPALDMAGLRDAFNLVRRIPVNGVRMHFYERLLFTLDRALYDHAAAVERRQRLERSGLDTEDLEAYLEQCLTALFAHLLVTEPDLF